MVGLDAFELLMFLLTKLLHDQGPFDTQSGQYFYFLMLLYVAMFVSLLLFVLFLYKYFIKYIRNYKYLIYAVLLNLHIVILIGYLILIKLDYL